MSKPKRGTLLRRKLLLLAALNYWEAKRERIEVACSYVHNGKGAQ